MNLYDTHGFQAYCKFGPLDQESYQGPRYPPISKQTHKPSICNNQNRTIAERTLRQCFHRYSLFTASLDPWIKEFTKGHGIPPISKQTHKPSICEKLNSTSAERTLRQCFIASISFYCNFGPVDQGSYEWSRCCLLYYGVFGVYWFPHLPCMPCIGEHLSSVYILV
jgi:hypothetical protein